MSRDGRKPWMTPVIYNDERWVEPKASENLAANVVNHGPSDNGDEKDAKDVEEILRRPDRPERNDYECTDTTPINYGNGPHDNELDTDDRDDLTVDQTPINYQSGPHEDEFGVEDDDEDLLPLGNEAEFPEL